MGILFFALSVFVIPGLPAGAQVGRWGLIAIAAAVMLFRCRLSWWSSALLVYLAVMCLPTPVGYDAANLYIHALFLVVLYSYAKQKNGLRNIAIGLGFGFAVNSLVVLGQEFHGLLAFPQLTPSAGLYFNRNIATEAGAMTMALVIGYRIWWLVPCIIPTLVWGSRAPVIALGCALALMAWRVSKWLAIASAATAVALAVVAHPDYITAAAMGPLGSMKERLDVWRDASAGFTLFGQGLGSWLVNFPLYQKAISPFELRWENAHDDAVQLVFELGVVGFGLVLAFIWKLWHAPRTPEFYALIVFAIEGLAGFPLYGPVTGALAAVCAGCLFVRSRDLRGNIIDVELRIRGWYAQRQRAKLLLGRSAVSVSS